MGYLGMRTVLRALKDRKSFIQHENALMDVLEAAFKEAKMKFRPGHGDVMLFIPGLPRYPDFGIPDKGRFRLTQSDLESLFVPQLDAMQKLIERQARSVAKLSPSKKITAVFFTGGPSRNAYIFAKLERRFEQRTNPVLGYKIRIRRCIEHADTNIARVACLSRLDSEFLRHRELSYSYGVVRDVPIRGAQVEDESHQRTSSEQ